MFFFRKFKKSIKEELSEEINEGNFSPVEYMDKKRRYKVKFFISQIMKNKTKEEILKEREEILAKVREKYNDYLILDTYFEGFNTDKETKNIPLKYLAKSIEFLSEADLVVFGKGWETARGCKIEHSCAVESGIEVMYI